jgi:hypothetical protein
VQSYLERDLRELAQVQSLPDFQRLLALLALQNAQVLNETALSRKHASSQVTVHRHISLVEVSNLLYRLPAWAVNRGKRVSKRPKLHLADPGLAAFLAELHSVEEVCNAREAGALFGSLVWQQLRVLASLMERPARLRHWRSSDGKEVDLVLSSSRKLLAFECKWTERAAPRVCSRCGGARRQPYRAPGGRSRGDPMADDRGSGGIAWSSPNATTPIRNRAPARSLPPTTRETRGSPPWTTMQRRPPCALCRTCIRWPPEWFALVIHLCRKRDTGGRR